MDSLDDYLCMTESTSVETMYRFYKAVVAVFGGIYVRALNEYSTHDTRPSDRIFWDASEHRLYILEVE